nr:MAG TPA: hypothetical protein [Caudoviricetes sp.]
MRKSRYISVMILSAILDGFKTIPPFRKHYI